MEKGLVHVVLISFKKETPDEVRQDIYDRYQVLGQLFGGPVAGLLYWKVGHNLDLRKNVHLMEVAVFTDKEALERFRVHPKHKELTDILCKVADWQVGDFINA